MNHTNLSARITQVINKLEPEFRIPVMSAAANSDGSFLSFQMELASQVWDNPTLDVEGIINQVAYDLV